VSGRTGSLSVAVIGPARFPVAEPFAGGLEAHTHALTLGLQRRGHRVTLFAAPGSDRRLGPVDLAVDSFSSSPAARADVGAPPEQWMREHHAYLDLMLSLGGQRGTRRATAASYDVVHDNSLHHLPVAMAGTLPSPVVTTLHTPPVPWLESAAVLRGGVHPFVTVSTAMATAWRHVLESQVIPNGVDTTQWRAGPGGTRAVWSGRLVPEKAPHEAVLAARRAGIAIDLAGPMLDRAYFDRHLRPLLGSRARYLGHLGQQSLRHLVAHARVVLVTPAWDEPFGLVAAEALACGTPVAAYDRGALREVVTPDVGALAPAGDVDALASAIDRAVRLDRGAARDRAQRCFSLDAMLDAYEQLYVRVGSRDLVA
jgi:glycosyltransferase involved in cell wall biosynthesis